MKAVPLKLGCYFSYSLAGNGIGLDVTVNNEDGEFEVFVHEGVLEGVLSSVEALPASTKLEFIAWRAEASVSASTPTPQTGNASASLWTGCSN
ncbi:hypothetical protein MT1_2575 [Pseudomonas sp. MT-1]|nr:hypothetical protein MT1_2575 [Pseudomonas sp. MT-1]